MSELQFPEVKLKHPDGEHVLQITPEFGVALDDKVLSIQLNGAIVLNTLFNHVNSLVSTPQIWEEVQDVYPGDYARPEMAHQNINGHINRMQKGLGTYRPLGSLGQHIFRLGERGQTRNILIEDVTDVKFGLDKIAECAAGGWWGRTDYYQQAYSNAFRAVFDPTAQPTAAAEKKSQPTPRTKEKKSDTSVSAKERKYAESAGERMSEQMRYQGEAFAAIRDAQPGTEFSNEELTDNRYLNPAQEKANYEAIRQAIAKKYLTSYRNNKGRTIFVRTEVDAPKPPEPTDSGD